MPQKLSVTLTCVEILCPVQPQIYQHAQVWWHVHWTRHTHTHTHPDTLTNLEKAFLLTAVWFPLLYFLFSFLFSLCVYLFLTPVCRCGPCCRCFLSLFCFLCLSVSLSLPPLSPLYEVILVWWWYFLHLCTCFSLACMCHIAIKISLTLGMSPCGYCCLPIRLISSSFFKLKKCVAGKTASLASQWRELYVGPQFSSL